MTCAVAQRRAMPSDRFKRYRHTDKGRFTRHKANAKRRGVPFLFTFEDWLGCWRASGYWRVPGYVMCRLGDVGAYERGNVYIGTVRSNTRDRNHKYGLPRRPGQTVTHALKVPRGTTDN